MCLSVCLYVPVSVCASVCMCVCLYVHVCGILYAYISPTKPIIIIIHNRSLSQEAWLSLALSLEELPAEKVGELRGKYGDIVVPSLEQVVEEMMNSQSVQPRILIGEITGHHDVTETTKQLMTRLLTAVSMQ